MQNWKKEGLIYTCRHDGTLPFYAAVPFVKQLKGNHVRIYYSGRNLLNQSVTLYFDYDIETRKILTDNGRILLKPEKPGAFDDAGTVLFQIVSYKDEHFLFYSGWTLEVQVPFRFTIGIAKSKSDDKDFLRISDGPVVGQTIFDPYMAGAPAVIIENGIWKMWYITCTKWMIENGVAKHYYLIKYTESQDGIHWFNERSTAIDFKNDEEFAIARPVVIREENIYKMWYSYRGNYYKIGYAESQDGITWKRKDEEIKMDVSDTGWDSEMVCYGFIFDHNNKRYMVYNGNGYGKSGIGLAVLENK